MKSKTEKALRESLLNVRACLDDAKKNVYDDDALDAIHDAEHTITEALASAGKPINVPGETASSRPVSVCRSCGVVSEPSPAQDREASLVHEFIEHEVEVALAVRQHSLGGTLLQMLESNLQRMKAALTPPVEFQEATCLFCGGRGEELRDDGRIKCRQGCDHGKVWVKVKK